MRNISHKKRARVVSVRRGQTNTLAAAATSSICRVDAEVYVAAVSYQAVGPGVVLANVVNISIGRICVSPKSKLAEKVGIVVSCVIVGQGVALCQKWKGQQRDAQETGIRPHCDGLQEVFCDK